MSATIEPEATAGHVLDRWEMRRSYLLMLRKRISEAHEMEVEARRRVEAMFAAREGRPLAIGDKLYTPRYGNGGIRTGEPRAMIDIDVACFDLAYQVPAFPGDGAGRPGDGPPAEAEAEAEAEAFARCQP